MDIQTPTDEERAYHQGWTAYYRGLDIDTNPYSMLRESNRFQAWCSGWETAQKARVEL